MVAPRSCFALEIEPTGSRDHRVGLWCAVIELAWLDAFERTVKIGPNASKKNRRERLSEFQREREQALRFLLDKRGPWTRSREQVCALAGICPDALHERALAVRETVNNNSTRSIAAAIRPEG